jgi:hypothetical protein
VRTQEDLPGRFFLSRRDGVVGDAGRAPEVVDEAMLRDLALGRALVDASLPAAPVLLPLEVLDRVGA